MPREPLLVTGGAGYIGSHAVLAFRAAGYPVVVLDDLSAGRREAVPDDVPFVAGDVGDMALVRRLVDEHGIAAVVHFAGSVVVAESICEPLRYYRNNSAASADLIRVCVERGVGRFVFSSTAAVYGVPAVQPVGEDAATVPISPYGRSKLVTEWVLRDTAAAHDLRYVCLRYFNVAGADPWGRAGQSTTTATHLVKVAAEAATGRRDHVTVFGTDYDTPDGTCVRDYIHVSDLAAAHLVALRALENGGESRVLNCGYGHGFSVRAVLDAVEAHTGVALDIRDGPRRAGDPPELVADSARLRGELGWHPRHDDLDTVVATAIAWERQGSRPPRPPCPRARNEEKR